MMKDQSYDPTKGQIRLDHTKPNLVKPDHVIQLEHHTSPNHSTSSISMPHETKPDYTTLRTRPKPFMILYLVVHNHTMSIWDYRNKPLLPLAGNHTNSCGDSTLRQN